MTCIWFQQPICSSLPNKGFRMKNAGFSGCPVITIITISTLMNQSPNGASSSKIASYGWVGKRPHRSPWTIFSFLIWISPCFVSLQICVTSALSCSRTRWCLWTHSHISHLPSTSCCQRQPGPPSQQEFRHPLEGKTASGVAVTVHKPCLSCSQGSAPRAKLEEWWMLRVIHPKILQDNPLCQKPQCLSGKKSSLRRLKLGISGEKKKKEKPSKAI